MSLVGICLVLAILCCAAPFRVENVQVGGEAPVAADSKTEAPEQSPESSGAVIDEARAFTLARDELERRGRDPKRYTVSAQREKDLWVVTFIGKQPRPPGDLIRVLVAAADGAIRDVHMGK